MTSTVVITIVVVAAIIWLSVLAVSALRARGPEEVSANLRPGATDEELETRRLDRIQRGAVLLSAFLAIGIPLYYLGETQRQEGFVEQFAEESVDRGLHVWEEFRCFTCHGQDGVGGSVSFTEKRSGATVTWEAPSLDDVFFRYDRDDVRFWIVFGRANTPMPAWGLEGGGPLNESQVEDLLNYLETIQVPQEDVAREVETTIASQLASLEGAEATMALTILEQRQRIAELERAPELAPIVADLAERAGDLSDALGEGFDSDGDGVSDDAEAAVNALTAEARTALLLPGLEELSFAPDNAATNDGIPDDQAAQEALATLRELSRERAPILTTFADAIEAALAITGEDGDGDGIADEAEGQITGQLQAAVTSILPAELRVTNLDPANPETQGGVSDRSTAVAALSGIETVAQQIGLDAENQETLMASATETLDHLQDAARRRDWAFDFEAIAANSFDGDVEVARRVVGIYQGYCARCHTSGFSAGLPFAQRAGSGAMGPALWKGRETVQFLDTEDLTSFLIEGSEDGQAYGVNGVGTGRMPGFGMILSEEDLANLAHWLQGGDLDGRGDS